MLVQVGVDPGLTGAIAVFHPQERTAEFYDTPTVTVKSGKKFKNMMDTHAIVALLKGISEGREVLVTIEKVNAMPGWKNDPEHPGERVAASMGVTSAFNFGYGFGIWIGVLTALGLPFQQVHPVTWKRRMLFDAGKEKDASRVKAMQLFPKTAGDLKLKKHHGRADALLIAAWAQATNSAIPEIAEPEEEVEPTLF